MTIRELRPDEFHRLTAIDWLEPSKRPVEGSSRVVIAEKDGKIAGFWVIQIAIMIEPVWISPEHRYGTVGARMFQKVKDIIRKIGRGGFITHADTETNGGYLERLGLKKTDWVAYTGEV